MSESRATSRRCARVVNRCSRHTLLGVLGGALAISCGHTRRTLVYEQTTSLPSGRFTGPIELRLPAQSGSANRWFEIHAEVETRCGPLLKITYPDGEIGAVGDRDERWQALLQRRAEQREPSAGEAGVDRRSPDGPGRWRKVRTERWPGQLAFLQSREARCGQLRTFRSVHLTAVDRDQRLALWAAIPQELRGGALTVKVFEVVDVDGERAAAEKERAEIEAAARVESKPRPPAPPPKTETPKPAEAAGAVWVSGRWQWSGRRGTWVWVSGTWRRPATTPALRDERPGAPPIAGCAWVRGHWVWVPGNGSWRWIDGHWNPPPPRAETPGAPPVPESSWVAGRWVRAGGSFEWTPGYWGKPRPRAETRPPAPSRGARWQAGAWLRVKGTWVWSPGKWIGAGRTPPPRKREIPGRRPEPGAVWLKGYWRWDAKTSRFSWIAGRWERPPGEGYVWVADPVDQTAGVSLSGRWVLDGAVDVGVGVEVKR